MAHTTHIIMTAAAQMPSTCWGVYRRIAVVEIDSARLPEGCDRPRMISERARGVVRVVRTWERLHVGTTERCAYSRAFAEARELVTSMGERADA